MHGNRGWGDRAGRERPAHRLGLGQAGEAALALLVTELALSAAVGREARAGSMTFQYSGSLQSFDVTTTGTYLLAADGAQGGGSGNNSGGLGAEISGEIMLTARTELEIVVGGAGSPAGDGGGGGGNFIYISGATSPLLVAGGGGGGGFFAGAVGGGGQTGTAGQADVDVLGGAGGTNGNGGGSGLPAGGFAPPAAAAAVGLAVALAATPAATAGGDFSNGFGGSGFVGG